jgi:hypothetical protein
MFSRSSIVLSCLLFTSLHGADGHPPKLTPGSVPSSPMSIPSRPRSLDSPPMSRSNGSYGSNNAFLVDSTQLKIDFHCQRLCDILTELLCIQKDHSTTWPTCNIIYDACTIIEGTIADFSHISHAHELTDDPNKVYDKSHTPNASSIQAINLLVDAITVLQNIESDFGSALPESTRKQFSAEKITMLQKDIVFLLNPLFYALDKVLDFDYDQTTIVKGIEEIHTSSNTMKQQCTLHTDSKNKYTEDINQAYWDIDASLTKLTSLLEYPPCEKHTMVIRKIRNILGKYIEKCILVKLEGGMPPSPHSSTSSF